ncbi:MAG: OmpA family protein [Myxococcota bacterium]|nr:OmpA family protein [Myxococcota bacterium]
MSESARSLAPWLLALSVVSGSAAVAHADVGHTFRLEGGIAAPVTDPQTDLYGTGGGVALGYELLPVPYVGLEARFSSYWLPVSAANPSSHSFGTYYAPAIALRLHPLATQGVGDLWLGVGAAIAFTGDLVRPGLELGIGYELQAAWWLRVGPFVRYTHIFQTVPGSDAGFVSVGVSLAFGGEPPPPGDRDGDGILDVNDACPDEPEDADDFQDTDGCPDTDNDADGILDARDQCPNAPEDRDGFEDTDGCPDADNDGDQILDAADGCPNVAEDLDSFEDTDGCPDPDNDADGILDTADACPNEAETQNGHEDADGCPDVLPPPPRTETELQLERLGERIQFAQDSAEVLPASRAALRAVIALLRQHPEITRVIIEAHASSEGSSEHNMELSRERGQTVVDALVRGRIARDRVSSRAFGEHRPTVGGGTEGELAPNRRVTFITETSVQVPATP